MDLKIIDNCCSSYLLDCLKHIAIQSENWNLLWPQTAKVEDRFLKLDIVGEKGVVKNPFLAGLVQGLLIQIYEASGQEFFIPDIYFCGISMKDKVLFDYNNERDDDRLKDYIQFLKNNSKNKRENNLDIFKIKKEIDFNVEQKQLEKSIGLPFKSGQF